jgi:hypothetical protein
MPTLILTVNLLLEPLRPLLDVSPIFTFLLALIFFQPFQLPALLLPLAAPTEP